MNEELPTLIDEARAIADDAQKTFGHLSAEQLNWRPNADEWSVAQCFDHLIVINADYFPVIRNIARGEYKASLKERLPLLPRLFGSMILKAVQPEAQRKLKADPRFRPSSSTIDTDIIAKFDAHQREVIEHMKMTEHVNLRTVIITSPVASFATYSLLDAYKILVTHERRHMTQARRVMGTEGFPTREP
ncbi:MAG: DinB family protein [Luteitalea sp.]|nr:DinB family protein [Luteitalea sp.]